MQNRMTFYFSEKELLVMEKTGITKKHLKNVMSNYIEQNRLYDPDLMSPEEKKAMERLIKIAKTKWIDPD